MFFEPADLLWWKILAEAYNPDRGYMLLILVIAQAAQTHVTGEGCNVIYVP